MLTCSRLSRAFLPALLGLSFLLSACVPAAATSVPAAATSAPAAATSVPAAAPQIAPTATNDASVPNSDPAPQISLDLSGLASAYQAERVAAVADDGSVRKVDVLPAYTRLTLQAYPLSDRLQKPRIFIYPLQDLEKANPDALKVVASLQDLLQSPREIAVMPFLPLTGDVQAIHAHVQYLDFMSGKALRYLAEYANGMSPIHNAGLFYTFQGITADGRYYVAAVLPVSHPSLPADAALTGKEPPEFSSDYPTYLRSVVSALNPQAAATFTPDLTRLDALMSSLEIK